MPKKSAVETGSVHTFEGHTPVIDPSVFLAAGSHVIGNVVLEENVSVWFNTVIRGDVERIRIGRNSNVQDNVTIHVTHYHNPTLVGENVTIGHGAVLHGCTVRDGALIGMKAVVLDRAVIGEGSLVAAGAVVLGGTIVPPNSLVTGIPAKVRRPLDDNERAMVAEGSENYTNYVRHFRAEADPTDWYTGSFAEEPTQHT